MMRGRWRVAVIMPAHNEEKLIAGAIESVPDWVDHLIVINDGSTDDTLLIAEQSITSRGRIISTDGLGVGGALATGYQSLIDAVDSNLLPQGEWVAVVMAGDGQMNPADIDALLEPLERVPFTKGDRFSHAAGLGRMPKNRRIGSRILGVLTSLASGDRVRDPQCGFTAVRLGDLKDWDWVDEWHGYGYPNWWLLNLGNDSIPYQSVPVESVYRNEKSGIAIPSFFLSVSLMLLSGLWRRGWNWYVRGSGGTHIIRRLAVVGSWFASVGMLLAAPIVVLNQSLAAPIVLAGMASLGVAWYFDQQEVRNRKTLP